MIGAVLIHATSREASHASIDDSRQPMACSVSFTGLGNFSTLISRQRVVRLMPVRSRTSSSRKDAIVDALNLSPSDFLLSEPFQVLPPRFGQHLHDPSSPLFTLRVVVKNLLRPAVPIACAS